MKRIAFYQFSIISSVLLFYAFNNKPYFDKPRSEIWTMHNKTIPAHLNTDVDFFTKNTAENYFYVGFGEIRHPSNEDISRIFNNYAESTDFNNYSDIQGPIIGLSDDGSLTWSIVKVKVAGINKITPDSLNQFEDGWARITLKKRCGNI